MMNNKLFDTTYEDERLELEQEEDKDGIRIERYAFNSFRIERSIRDILAWVEMGKIEVPEFQRDTVWTFNQSSKFIESLLLGLPIPDFFMFRKIDKEEGTEKYILIDGLQRYSAIKQYTDGTYNVGKTERKFYINDKNSLWYKKTYADLNNQDKEFFLDYSLKINIFDSVAAEESVRSLYMTEIFARINTGSTKLSDQEVRNAVYSSEFSLQLKEFANNKHFVSLLQQDANKYSERARGQELILRFLTYNMVYNCILESNDYMYESQDKFKITSSKGANLSNYMFLCKQKLVDYEKELEDLRKVLEQIYRFDQKAFCTVRRGDNNIANVIQEVFSEALVIALLNGTIINITKEDFENAKIELWNNSEENFEFFQNTTNITNVKNRVYKIKKILEG